MSDYIINRYLRDYTESYVGETAKSFNNKLKEHLHNYIAKNKRKTK